MISASMTRTPASQIPVTRYMAAGGVCLLAERAKSFIQSVVVVRPLSAILPALFPAREIISFFRLGNCGRICAAGMKWNGIKGTIKSPSSKKPRWYRIRQDRIPLKVRLKSKSIAMIPQIHRLHTKKCITKLIISVAFLPIPFGKNGAERVDFRLREFVVLDICGHHR